MNTIELSISEFQVVCAGKCDCTCEVKEKQNSYASMKHIGTAAGAAAVGVGVLLQPRIPPILKFIIILSSVVLPAMVEASPPLLKCRCESEDC